MLGPKIGRPLPLVTVAAGTNNIPAAYADALGSLVGTNYQGHNQLEVYNNTAGDIALAFTGVGVLSASAVDNLVVKARTVQIFENLDMLTNIYIRSLTGSPIAAGTVYVGAY